MSTNHSKPKTPFFNKSTLLVCLCLSSSILSACHVKITFSTACILIGSCEDNEDTKYLQPLAIPLTDKTNCSYERLNFFYGDKPCELSIEKMDQKEMRRKGDGLVSSFLEVEESSIFEETEDMELDLIERGQISGCGLEANLDKFNSLSFGHQGLKIEFVMNTSRLIMI